MKTSRSQVLRARALRQNSSVIEQVFWSLARNNKLGFNVRRQHPVGRFTADFYVSEAKLAIEFDGEQHDPLQDEVRDQELLELGIETLRIPNRDFLMIDGAQGFPTDWIEKIKQRVAERSPGGPHRPSPSP